MALTEKVSVTLPKDLIRKISVFQRKTGETRSGLVSRAIRNLLRKQEEEARQRAYLDGYLKLPETAEEISEAEAIASETIALEPWE